MKGQFIRPFLVDRGNEGIFLHCRNRTVRILTIWEYILLKLKLTDATKLDKTRVG
jgi:hypothetical protein